MAYDGPAGPEAFDAPPVKVSVAAAAFCHAGSTTTVSPVSSTPFRLDAAGASGTTGEAGSFESSGSPSLEPAPPPGRLRPGVPFEPCAALAACASTVSAAGVGSGVCVGVGVGGGGVGVFVGVAV